jgi:hypothetical protein
MYSSVRLPAVHAVLRGVSRIAAYASRWVSYLYILTLALHERCNEGATEGWVSERVVVDGLSNMSR